MLQNIPGGTFVVKRLCLIIVIIVVLIIGAVSFLEHTFDQMKMQVGFDHAREFRNLDGYTQTTEDTDLLGDHSTLTLDETWAVKIHGPELRSRDFINIVSAYKHDSQNNDVVYLIISYKETGTNLWNEYKDLYEEQGFRIDFHNLGRMQTRYFQFYDAAGNPGIDGLVDGDGFYYNFSMLTVSDDTHRAHELLYENFDQLLAGWR